MTHASYVHIPNESVHKLTQPPQQRVQGDQCPEE